MYNNNFGCYLVANIPGSYITKETESINTALFWIAAALILLSLILTFIVYVSICLLYTSIGGVKLHFDIRKYSVHNNNAHGRLRMHICLQEPTLKSKRRAGILQG